MPEDTTNHNLNRPDKGQTDWGDDLNQNFSDLDTALQNISQDGKTFSPERGLMDTVQSPQRKGGVLRPPLDRTRTKTDYHRPPTPTIAWTLDDGLISHYEHRSVFNDNGVKAGIAVNTDPVGNSGNMTWDQIRELVYADDWTLFNHSLDGGSSNRFNNLSESEIETQVYDAAEAFLNEGLSPYCFVYNGGETGGDTGKGIVSELYPYGLGTNDRAIGLDGNGSEASLGVDPYNVPRFRADARPESEIKSKIDTAVNNNTGLILNSHEIISGTTSDEGTGQTSTGKIKDIISYAKNNGMEWGTTEDVIGRSMSMTRWGGPTIGELYGTHGGKIVAEPQSAFQVSTPDGSGGLNVRMQVRGGNPTSIISLQNSAVDLNSSVWFQNPKTTSSTDDPTSNSPDGYMEIEVGGTTKAVPYYST